MSAGGGGHNLRKRKNKEKPEEDVQSIYPDLSKEIDHEDIVDEEIDGEVDGAEVKRVEQETKNREKNTGHAGPKKGAKKRTPKRPDHEYVEDESRTTNESGHNSTTQDESRTTNESGHDNTTPFFICLAVMLAAAVAVILLVWFIPHGEEGSGISFKVKIDKLQQKFGNQNKDLWPVIKKLGDDHLIHIHNDTIPDPTRPLVFVFTSIRENDKVLMCLALEIGNAFSSSKDAPKIPVINGNHIANEAHSKEMLDQRLEGILNSTTRDQGVVIVTELGSLNYETASIFFKYCDNEGAPYPKAVFLFTLSMNMDESFLKQSRKEITKATRDHLSSVVWADGDKSETDALIARIIDPFPFAIMKEDMSVVKNCP
eukprot:Seg4069.5 transcript_id=Seg4069.5/GoldUCD/mRNA.D3Y31 product="Torsin-1A-interacting protein 1" protein_id=Seg4069.5/GoldUCD/D3Y31